MTIRFRSLLTIAAALLLAMNVAAPAATIQIGNSNNADCTFWCVDRVQQVYDSSFFAGVSNISRVSFFASPIDGYEWDGTGVWQMSLSTSNNPIGALDPTFNNNVGADNAVFAVQGFAAGDLPANTLVSFFGSFNYDPNLGDLLVDIVRVAGNPVGVPMDAGITPGALDRAYAFNSTVFADGYNQGGYGLRTEFAVGPAEVPVPAAAWMGMTLLAGLGGLRLARNRRAK